MRINDNSAGKQLFHFLMIAVFMFIADHQQRAHYDQFYRWTNWLVNAIGAFSYLGLHWVVRGIVNRPLKI